MDNTELKKMYEKIEESNAQFAAADRQGKRVQIAKDVLMQLEARRLNPGSTYLEYPHMYEDFNGQMSEALKRVPSCRVCAIGALFVVTVDRMNDVSFEEFRQADDYQYAIQKYLNDKLGLFSAAELVQLENYFERVGIGDDVTRMQDLMKLIIEKQGAPIEHEDLLRLRSERHDLELGY